MTIVTMLNSWLPEATPDCSPVPANWPTMMRSAAPYMAWRNSASSTGNAKEIKDFKMLPWVKFCDFKCFPPQKRAG